MVDIDKIFPIDPEFTEEQVEAVLKRPAHIIPLAVGGVVLSAVTVQRLWRYFHPNHSDDQVSFDINTQY